MLDNGPNHLSDEDDGAPVPSSSQHCSSYPTIPPTQWPRLMKPPPFLISAAAVINYVCPTPNTNIVIFGGKILDLFHCGGRRSEMNGLPSWSFAGMRRRRREGRVGWVGGVIRSLGGGVTVEDMNRASQGKPSLQGKTSLGLSAPVQGSDSNCLGT